MIFVNVKIKEVKKYKKILSVEVPLEDVQKVFNDVYREISNSANMPGFRKGKIPMDVVKKHYKADAEQEVLKRLLPSAYSQAVEENNLRPVLQPTINKVDFKPDSPLTFEAEVTVRPEIKLPKYKGIDIELKKMDVQDKDVDSAVNNLLERNATFEPISDRGVEMGDFAQLDYEIFVDGASIDSAKDLLWPIEEKGFYPNFAQGLVGAKIGEARDIDTTLPKEYMKEEYRNKKAVIKTTVKEIKVKKIAELNDEFVKELGMDINSVDDLKTKIREEMSRYNDDIKRMDKENKICEFLVKKTSIEVPPELVEKQVDFLVQDEKQRHQQHQAAEVTDEAKLRESLKEKAESQVKLYFVLEVLAETENISVTDQDVDERIKEIAARMGKNYMDAKKHFVSDGKIETLKDKIREDKVIRFVGEQAQVKEK